MGQHCCTSFMVENPPSHCSGIVYGWPEGEDVTLIDWGNAGHRLLEKFNFQSVPKLLATTILMELDLPQIWIRNAQLSFFYRFKESLGRCQSKNPSIETGTLQFSGNPIDITWLIELITPTLHSYQSIVACHKGQCLDLLFWLCINDLGVFQSEPYFVCWWYQTFYI